MERRRRVSCHAVDDGEFWRIVEASRADTQDEQASRLRTTLHGLGETDRARFRDRFAEQMCRACDWDLWDASDVAFAGMDDEAFFGLRAWVVSRGCEAFRQILEDPDRLAEHEVASFPEFAAAAGADPSQLEAEEYTGSSVPDDDDDTAFADAFPRTWARYCGAGRRARAMLAALLSVDEHRVLGQIFRASVVGVLGLCAVAAWYLPWWASAPACCGIIAAAAYLGARAGTRRITGWFLSYARDVGHARRLVGDVNVAVVFVQVGSTRVPASFDDTIRSAFDFLGAEASRFGVHVRFHRRPSQPLQIAVGQLHDPVLDRFDPRAIAALKKDLRPLLPSGNAFVLVVTPDSRCTATAWHATRFANTADVLEFCICPATATTKTVAHEILHVFGALDLYRRDRPNGRVDYATVQVVSEVVEKATGEDILATSIMTNKEGSALHVDPATALSIGWTDRLCGRRVRLFRPPRRGKPTSL